MRELTDEERRAQQTVYRRWIAEMYRAMDFLLRSGAYDAVNAWLRDLPALPSDRSIAALRFLSVVPDDKLPEWQALLERVEDEIPKTDRERMLRGLR